LLVLLDALSLWPRRLLSLLQLSFVVSRWLLPEYPRQVPPPTLPFHLHQVTWWLPSTMTGCHTNTATAPLSACHEAPEKTLPIQADLSWSSLFNVPLCTAAFSFFFSSYYILLPFCLVCLNRHLLLFGPEAHSLQACLSLCPSSKRVLSLWNRTGHLSFPPDTPATYFNAAFCSCATWQSWWTQHEVYPSLTAHLMLPCHHHAFQRTDCPLPPF